MARRPAFQACYGWGEDDDKLPDLMVRLITQVAALLGPQTIRTKDPATEKILQDLHIIEYPDGDCEYGDEIMSGV